MSTDKPPAPGNILRQWTAEPDIGPGAENVERVEMSTDKPSRECTVFYIDGHLTGASPHINARQAVRDEEPVPMIEKSAYEKLQAEVERLTKELEQLTKYDVDTNSATGWMIKYTRMQQERDDLAAEKIGLLQLIDGQAAQLAEAAKVPPIATNTGWPHEKKMKSLADLLQPIKERLERAVQTPDKVVKMSGLTAIESLRLNADEDITRLIEALECADRALAQIVEDQYFQTEKWHFKQTAIQARAEVAKVLEGRND
jgi:hypothetical protein